MPCSTILFNVTAIVKLMTTDTFQNRPGLTISGRGHARGMGTEFLLDEQRMTKRFRVKEKVSFVANSSWPDKGVLVDIGKGGLAFHYVSELPWPDGTDQGCQVLGEHNSSLANVPGEVVADRIIHCGQGNSMIVRRRSIKFGLLTEQQQFLLECFIWINGVMEC